MIERWGTLHLVVPDPTAGPYDDREVVASHERIYYAIEYATQLWRFLGREDEAKRVYAIIARASEREVATLDQWSIHELLPLLDTLPDALREQLALGEHDLLSANQIAALRARTDLFDLEVSRQGVERHAVAEAIGEIQRLAAILRDAQAQGLHVIFN